MITGKLVICPTPLGNLEDVTLRSLRVLRESDVIFAEDTRVTKTLLRHYDIQTPLRSFHERTARARVRELHALLSGGKTAVVVSDAGMPGISDPGIELVREARKLGTPVEVLPGPSAVPAAVVLSGFEEGSFRFDGFPPRKPGELCGYLERLASERAAVVWFEAPTRVLELLRAVAAVLPERRIFVVREYTKKFEQQLLGTAGEVALQLASPPRGEFTLVLEGQKEMPVVRTGNLEAALAFLRQSGVSARDAAHAIRLATGASRNELYRLALKRGRT